MAIRPPFIRVTVDGDVEVPSVTDEQLLELSTTLTRTRGIQDVSLFALESEVSPTLSIIECTPDEPVIPEPVL